MDPDQTAPVSSGSTLFVEEVSETIYQTTKADDLCCIGAQRVNKSDFQFIIIRSRFLRNGRTFARLKQLINHVNTNIT